MRSKAFIIIIAALNLWTALASFDGLKIIPCPNSNVEMTEEIENTISLASFDSASLHQSHVSKVPLDTPDEDQSCTPVMIENEAGTTSEIYIPVLRQNCILATFTCNETDESAFQNVVIRPPSNA